MCSGAAATVMDDTMYVVAGFHKIVVSMKSLREDKTACWTYGDKVYLFGGFGPPPASQVDKLGSLFEFVEDPTTTSGYSSYTRGWSNQLVVYNSLTNRWEWPACTGQAP